MMSATRSARTLVSWTDMVAAAVKRSLQQDGAARVLHSFAKEGCCPFLHTADGGCESRITGLTQDIAR